MKNLNIWTYEYSNVHRKENNRYISYPLCLVFTCLRARTHYFFLFLSDHVSLKCVKATKIIRVVLLRGTLNTNLMYSPVFYCRVWTQRKRDREREKDGMKGLRIHRTYRSSDRIRSCNTSQAIVPMHNFKIPAWNLCHGQLYNDFLTSYKIRILFRNHPN